MSYLSDLSASELNAAIDDTNFPKIINAENYDGYNGSTKNFETLLLSLNRDIPTPLKGPAFNDNYSGLPSTPKTPRTTTTPGNIVAQYFLVFY